MKKILLSILIVAIAIISFFMVNKNVKSEKNETIATVSEITEI